MYVTASLTVVMMWLVGCVVPGTVIDLTHPLDSGTVYWPGVPGFNRTRLMAGLNENKIWIEVGVITSGEHGGTHVDAPRHFNQRGFDLKDLPLELTIAEGVMIDVTDEAAMNQDYVLTVEKIEEWEQTHGRIPDQAAVIINTGWSSRWPDPKLILNSNTSQDQTTFHFPTVSGQAAQWLVEHRHIKMLGVDVPTPDSPRDTTFPVHTFLLTRNLLILENVKIPDTLPARHFRLHASPIRIEGGSGTQTRIYAMLHAENSSRPGHAHLSIIGAMFFVYLTHVFTRKF